MDFACQTCFNGAAVWEGGRHGDKGILGHAVRAPPLPRGRFTLTMVVVRNPVAFVSTRTRLSPLERVALAGAMALFIGVLTLAWHWKVINPQGLFGLFGHADWLFWALLTGLCVVFAIGVAALHFLSEAQIIFHAEGIHFVANAPPLLAPIGLRSRNLAWNDIGGVTYSAERGAMTLHLKQGPRQTITIDVNAWRMQTPDPFNTFILQAGVLGEPDLVYMMRELGLLDAGSNA